MSDFNSLIPKLVFGFLPFLFALCFHEFSHGWVANKLGDPTAKLMGRLTLNPVAHASLWGTIILPLVGMVSGLPVIGWANPVPVNSKNLRNQKMGMFWVALAGPGSNMFLASIAAVSVMVIRVHYAHAASSAPLEEFAESFLVINLWLAFFNLIPINPLDGGKVFAIFLTDKMRRQLEGYESYAPILLMLLFFTGALQFIIAPFVNFTGNLMLVASAHLLGAA